MLYDIPIFDLENNILRYDNSERGLNSKIIFKDVKGRINWLLINNKIDFYKLNRLEQECLIILQPYIDLFELNWIIYDCDYMESSWDKRHSKLDRYKYAVRIGAPEDLNNNIQKYINKLYGKNTINIETNKKSMESKYKELDSPRGRVILDIGPGWIRYNSVSDGYRLDENELIF